MFPTLAADHVDVNMMLHDGLFLLSLKKNKQAYKKHPLKHSEVGLHVGVCITMKFLNI